MESIDGWIPGYVGGACEVCAILLAVGWCGNCGVYIIPPGQPNIPTKYTYKYRTININRSQSFMYK